VGHRRVDRQEGRVVMIRRLWWALFAFWTAVYALGAVLHVLLPAAFLAFGGVILFMGGRWMFPPHISRVDYARIRQLERDLGMTPGPLMAKAASRFRSLRA
jgi:hypothetical protein